MDYADRTIDEFLSAVASGSVVPAGGSGAAVVGAVGASLCEMVCIHTVESDEPAGGLADVRADLARQRAHLLRLAGTDAAVVEASFGGGNPGESDLKRAVGVPLTVAEACLTVLELAADVAAAGTRNALPDAATGVFLARGALRASVYTARYNLAFVSDGSFVDSTTERAADIEAAAERAEERALRTVEERA